MIYVFAIILGAALLTLSWIDFKTYRLPDIFTLPLIGIGFLQSYIFSSGILESVIGAAAGYLSFVAVEIGFKYIRGKDGLGRGDAKLMAAAGAWCGWVNLPYIVLIASGSGLIMLLIPSFRVHTDGGRLPFGPFIAFGFYLVWMVTSFGFASG